MKPASSDPLCAAFIQRIALITAERQIQKRIQIRICHAAGGELGQIQFLLGRVSIQTTEQYLGCKQRIRAAVNDRIGIEPCLGAGNGAGGSMALKPADEMDPDQNKVDEITLALLWLTSFKDAVGTRAWKGQDWDTMERLHAKGLISDPKAGLNPSY